MPPPRDPVKLAEYRAKMRRIALDRGYGKWMEGKSPTAETRAKLSAAGKRVADVPGEREARSERAKAAGAGTWMAGRTALPQTAAGLARGRDLTYDERYGDRAEDERSKRRNANRARWDGVPRKPQRDKHNGDHRYTDWRTAVFQRDDYTCRRCGTKGGKLHAHHVLRWATHPAARYEVDNGITLCQDDHARQHREDGY